MKKRIALLASMILAAHLTSCTSKDSKDESDLGDDVVAESSEGTDAELDPDAPAGDDAVASSDGANEGFLDDQLPEEALGESAAPAEAPVADAGTPPAEVASNATPPPGDEPSMEAMVADAPPPSNDLALDEALGSVDTGTPPPEEPPPPLADSPTTDTSTASTLTDLPPPVSDTPTTDVAQTDASTSLVSESKPKASLKKVEAAPFKRKGVLLNAVYVARPGDDYKKISTLIYGDNSKAKELAKVNPSLSKKPKVGDKVYYNSPARAADDSKLLTFYEDSGMMPELYIAKEGDNIKKVAKELLGYDNAWKEIWVTNSVDSKGDLAAGTELRYWKTAPAAAAPVSEVATMDAPPVDPSAAPMPEMPPPPPAEMAPPPPVAGSELPPPDMSAPPADMPPPVADLPPPPPAEAMNPPPPPPMPKKLANGMEDGGMDQDMMMSLAGAGIIAAGLAMVIIIRKRRQDRDRMNNAFSDTQVGT